MFAFNPVFHTIIYIYIYNIKEIYVCEEKWEKSQFSYDILCSLWMFCLWKSYTSTVLNSPFSITNEMEFYTSSLLIHRFNLGMFAFSVLIYFLKFTKHWKISIVIWKINYLSLISHFWFQFNIHKLKRPDILLVPSST